MDEDHPNEAVLGVKLIFGGVRPQVRGTPASSNGGTGGKAGVIFYLMLTPPSRQQWLAGLAG